MAAAPPPENSSFFKEKDEHRAVFLIFLRENERERKEFGGRERE
jgi:hypothetical protein